FIDCLAKVGAGRFKSSAACAVVVNLPFGMMCADVEASEVLLPSCEYVDADDTDALDGRTVARVFFGLEGVAPCVDMSFARTRGIVCRDVESRSCWGKGPSEAYI